MRQNDLYGWIGRTDDEVRYGFYGRRDILGNILVRHFRSEQNCQLGEDNWFALPFEVYANVRI